MKSIFPIALSSLLIGGAIGYIAGNGSSDSEDEQSNKVVANSGGGDRSRSIGGTSSSGDSGESRSTSSYVEIMQEPGQTARLQALLDRYSSLSADEFADETSTLDNLPFSERILAAYLLFGAWAEVDPYLAMEHANTKMGRAGMFVRPTVLQSWAATDPRGAAAYFENNKTQFAMMGLMGGRGGGSGSATIAGEWAKQDPDAALQWANTLEGKEKSDATSKALSQMAVTDPSRAAALTEGLEGRALKDAYSSIASEWAKKSWTETESWVSGLPADDQDSAMGAAVESLALENPKLAGTKALAMAEGEARDEAVEKVAEEMASQGNPGEAVSWVMENGSEDAQRETIEDVMGSWVSQDPTKARAWIDDQPEGRVRDSGVSSYIMNSSESGPDTFALAESIGDDRTRGWTVGVTAVRMASSDKEGAISKVQESQAIDDSSKERILGRINGESRGWGRDR